LNINTEELSRYVAKVVPVNEITDSKLSIFKLGKSECIISMNIHECVSCADDVNKHGDVQIKRVGHLTPTDNHTAISGPIFFMYGLKFAETLQFYKSG
jgi:hypothetical protein